MTRTTKKNGSGEPTLPKLLDLAAQAGATRISRPADKTVFFQFTPTSLRDFATLVLKLPTKDVESIFEAK